MRLRAMAGTQLAMIEAVAWSPWMAPGMMHADRRCGVDVDDVARVLGAE